MSGSPSGSPGNPIVPSQGVWQTWSWLLFKCLWWMSKFCQYRKALNNMVNSNFFSGLKKIITSLHKVVNNLNNYPIYIYFFFSKRYYTKFKFNNKHDLFCGFLKTYYYKFANTHILDIQFFIHILIIHFTIQFQNTS